MSKTVIVRKVPSAPTKVAIVVAPSLLAERVQKTAAASGADAQGYALAQSAIGEAIHEGDTWNRYVSRLIEFSVEARTAFVKELRKHTRDITEHVKQSGDTPEERTPYRDMSRSARTRLSELMTIANALNGGMVIAVKVDERGLMVRDSEGYPQPREKFYVQTGNARAFMRSEGTASAAGRKRDPFIVAAVKYIDKRDPAPEDSEKKQALLSAIAKMFPEEYAAATVKAA